MLFNCKIIQMYPVSPFVTGGQLAIAILVLLSYPLQLHPCRASLHKVTAGDTNLETARFSLLTLCIMFFSYVIAITGTFFILRNVIVNDLSTILSFVGATGSTTICYILPGLFYYKMKILESPELASKDWLFSFSVFLYCLGCCVMVTSLIALVSGASMSH